MGGVGGLDSWYIGGMRGRGGGGVMCGAIDERLSLHICQTTEQREI